MPACTVVDTALNMCLGLLMAAYLACAYMGSVALVAPRAVNMTCCSSMTTLSACFCMRNIIIRNQIHIFMWLLMGVITSAVQAAFVMVLVILRVILPVRCKFMPPGNIIYRFQAAVSLDPVNIEVKISVDSELPAALPDAPAVAFSISFPSD